MVNSTSKHVLHRLSRYKLEGFSLLLLIIVAGCTYALWGGPEARHASEPEASADTIAAGPCLITDPTSKGLIEYAGTVAPGTSFQAAILSSGMSSALADTIQRYLGGANFNFRKCLPGQRFVAQVDSQENLRVFCYRLDNLSSWWILRDSSSSLAVEYYSAPIENKLVSVEGEVEQSVYQAMLQSGETSELVAEFADVLGYDIDFIFDPRIGDTFRVLVEKKFLNGKSVGYGRIVAAEYKGSVTGDVVGYFFSDTTAGVKGWFAPDGSNMQKFFMRSPLSILRVTSTFGMRVHPISGKRKMHTGTDYAAPKGTPVWAIGAGKVVSAGWRGGYGKLVEIQHPGGVRTRYGHLSRILVRRGQTVRQHQTIGRVGSTGYATGSHLHFEFLVNGRQRAPRNVKNPSLKSLPPELMGAFKRSMARADSLWQQAPRITSHSVTSGTTASIQ